MRLAETLFARNDDATYIGSLEAARDIDAYAVAKHGQADPSHHYAAEQRSLHKRGFVTMRITGPALGDGSFTVRDQNLMGLGIVFGGRGTRTTKTEAVEWARQWQARDPDKREVIDDTWADHEQPQRRPNPSDPDRGSRLLRARGPLSLRGEAVSRPERAVLGFDYLAGKEVSMTPSEWRAAYPPSRFRRETHAGETFYHSPRRFEAGAWIESRIAAEAYSVIPTRHEAAQELTK